MGVRGGVGDTVWGQGGYVSGGLRRANWKSNWIHSKLISWAPVTCRP